MDSNVAALVKQARKEIRSLKRPRDVRRDIWAGVIDLLAVIAGYLPEPYPTQRTLAAKLDMHRTTVTRRLAAAERLGLLARSEHPYEGGQMAGTNYVLLCLSEGLRASIARTHFQDTLCTQSKNSYSVGVQNVVPPSEGLLSAGLRPPDPEDQEATAMPEKWDPEGDWRGPAIGEDPRAPLPGGKVIHIDPAVRLARYFDEQWTARVTRPKKLPVFVRASNRGMAIGYIRKVMLVQMVPDHVEAFIDAFITEVLDGTVAVKEGQFGFERFAGWWGRAEISDPAETKRQREENERIIAEYRRLTGQ